MNRNEHIPQRLPETRELPLVAQNTLSWLGEPSLENRPEKQIAPEESIGFPFERRNGATRLTACKSLGKSLGESPRRRLPSGARLAIVAT
jgi:hypothetical protein